MRKKTVAVVDGDNALLKIYQEILSSKFDVVVFQSIDAFEDRVSESNGFDLVISELYFEAKRLPIDTMNFFVSRAPFLFVSSFPEGEADYELVSSVSADFMDKPFRNSALLKRCEMLSAHGSKFGVQMNASQMVANRNQKSSSKLTSQEFRLLSFLVSHKQDCIPIDQVIQVIWTSSAPYQRFHALLSRLRPKLISISISISVTRFGDVEISCEEDAFNE